MIDKLGIKSHKIATYDKRDFYDNWHEVNKNLAQRWDNVIKYNPHHDIGTTLTDKYWVYAITKLLDRWLPKKRKGKKILKYDLYNEATGTAKLTEWLISQGYEVYGVDISEEVVKRAKLNFKDRLNTRKQFKVGDIRSLPFRDETFDAVWSFGTIEHIRENQISVSEAYRVLKPGGRFITGINNRLDLWGSYLINELTNKVYKHITSYEASFFPWAQREWIVQAGFEDVNTSGMVMLPHGLRYTDLFLEWKLKNPILKGVWNNLIIKPAIEISKVLDSVDTLRLLAMHTTSYGTKPAKSKQYV